MIDNLDRIPHDRAVWRVMHAPLGDPADRLVSVDYGDGLIEQTTVGKAAWMRVRRWRYGWAPR